jgi:endoglucanase
MRFSPLFASLALPWIFVACAGGGHRVGGADQLEADAPGDPAHNLLQQSNFDDGVMLPWMTSFDTAALGEAQVKDGALCVHVEKGGKERWDAQIRHREMVARQGKHYTISFKAWASRDTKMTGKFGMAGAPYTDYWTKLVKLSTEKREFAYEFEVDKPDDPTVELAFHFGGHMIQGEGPFDICFDDIVLSEPDFTPAPKAAKVAAPAVRVNQVGYLPKQKKIAVVVTTATEPLDWKLLDASGKEVATGKTTPYGVDASSKDSLQTIDFSSVKATGEGFVLTVGEEKSDPFKIGTDVYAQLKVDAFKYFYHNRSGIEIKMPFAGQEQWARPAGHAKDEAKCAPEAGCDYSLDVTGGWYDAGDHGKYVVNGGISVWTLMNQYERAKHLKGDLQAFGDRPGLLPESGNKVPDLLDEARWEMEFLLRMQVPDGKPNAGMVHHKMHDLKWTALGLPPHEDPQPRFLRPVSTAATLNLAATAAQAARIWKTFDPAFSKRCLAAAEKAWAAAKKAPNKLALPADTIGGGPYDDLDVSDEFYWAAAELFITTGGADYQKELKDSKLDGTLSPTAGGDANGTATAMNWQRVDGLGKISLAVVPNKLSSADYRKQIETVADAFLAIQAKEGYQHPMRVGADGGYPWGSNSFVINNALVYGLAYDFTKDQKYMDGAVLAMDYILGRNGMAMSYVSGYGTRALTNPHHRFWAHQSVPSFPKAPPGALSGGPNSGLQDPYAKAAGLAGCAPQKCYVDHIEAWSTNEITVNWNAPLLWVTSWLDEHSK